jgi:bifunctional DNase/RNase
MEAKLVKCEIQGIAMDPESNSPFILLGDSSGEQSVSIPVGPTEASSIILYLEGVQPPRPLTHDLISNFMHKHKFHAKNIVLYNIGQDLAHATLQYRKGFKAYSMDLRPSDAIALAVRFDIEILCDPILFLSSETLIESDLSSEDVLFFQHNSEGMH